MRDEQPITYEEMRRQRWTKFSERISKGNIPEIDSDDERITGSCVSPPPQPVSQNQNRTLHDYPRTKTSGEQEQERVSQQGREETDEGEDSEDVLEDNLTLQIMEETDINKLRGIALQLRKAQLAQEEEIARLKERPENLAKELKDCLAIAKAIAQAGTARSANEKADSGQPRKVPLVKGRRLLINEDDLGIAMSYGMAGSGSRAMRSMLNKIVESLYSRSFMGTHPLTRKKNPLHKEGDLIKPALPKEDLAVIVKFTMDKWQEWHKIVAMEDRIHSAISDKLGTESKELKKLQKRSEISAETVQQPPKGQDTITAKTPQEKTWAADCLLFSNRTPSAGKRVSPTARKQSTPSSHFQSQRRLTLTRKENCTPSPEEDETPNGPVSLSTKKRRV